MSDKTPHESSGESSSEAPSQSPATLPKAYDPSIIESRWAEYWVRERLFEVPTPATNPGAPHLAETWNKESNKIPCRPTEGLREAVGGRVNAREAVKGRANAAFTMLLPPPNVTGYLHMGHMFEHTESDILTRWRRMSGDTAVWVPGTDHAGIATQMLVERQLTAEGTDRKNLGREAFTARVWEWKRQYGSAITDQMKRLGASVDWSREYFTMDDRLSRAVVEAFVRLYEQGLIYRGAYIVNWDPVQQTAVSDLEVTHEERLGKLYHIRYPFADGTDSIVIATTRPETMLGDVAVAVNPNDERYKNFIGKLLTLPLSGVSGGPNRIIPILADSWANPEFGTGAVKVTPAHDPNDFAIGQRHSLPSLTILDESAHISLVGSPYFGLDRFAARERIVADLYTAGLLVDVRDHNYAIALSQRTRAVIEPRLSLQWFLAVNKPVVDPKTGDSRPSIAQTAIDAVEPRDGSAPHISFVPEMYKKVYLEWMTNIHDWCISRQLWWGHRIPAWYCAACSAITVARTAPAACSACGSARIEQSTDVLDTWFSSGLLPFTVFGWPADPLTTDNSQLTTDLAAFYPTTQLVTGFDILFFWVARMIMLGCHFMLDVPMPDGSPRTLADAVPFRNVYIHALIRDANREKMSKTKGNVVDPIDIIQRFGTDAVRFTLASMASPGTDIAFNEDRTDGYRAFANKIWNAARFLFMNLDRAKAAGYALTAPTPHPASEMWAGAPIETKWIFEQLSNVCHDVDLALSDYRFDEAANATYHFFWGAFCDSYLEVIKVRLDFSGEQNAVTELTLSALVTVFEAALRLLSPFMPFITEELWHALYATIGVPPPATTIALTRFPQSLEFFRSADAVQPMGTLLTLIVTVRALRKELGVPEKEATPIRIFSSGNAAKVAKDNADILAKQARVASVEIVTTTLTGNNVRSTPAFDVAVLYSRTIDIPAERERLTKDLAKQEKNLASSERQLSNEAFMAKAPAHIVEGLRKQAAETRLLFEKSKAALDALPES